MTNAREHKPLPGDGISRRDFVLGLGWLRESKNTVSQQTPASSVDGPSRPVARRYPRPLQDHTANDPPGCSDSPPGNLDSPFGPRNLPAAVTRRRTIPVLRPPGAIEESSFLAGCTRCELCMQACPHNAIIHAPARLREAAGTPIIDADRQPCLMCADYPCIAACEPGVLTTLVPPVMGTAKITEQLCLPHQGTSCTECSDQCPVTNAILISDGKPNVSEACIGCGICRSVCPAPENAVLLIPMWVRPLPEVPQHISRGNKLSHD